MGQNSLAKNEFFFPHPGGCCHHPPGRADLPPGTGYRRRPPPGQGGQPARPRFGPMQYIVPDLRGRFLLGADDRHIPNSIGGEENHTLTISEMPSHMHPSLYDKTGNTFPPAWTGRPASQAPVWTAASLAWYLTATASPAMVTASTPEDQAKVDHLPEDTAAALESKADLADLAGKLLVPCNCRGQGPNPPGR